MEIMLTLSFYCVNIKSNLEKEKTQEQKKEYFNSMV